MSYNSNFLNLLNGYTNLPTQEGDEGGIEKRVILSDKKTPADETADVRDILSFFAGGGYTSLSDEDAKSAFKVLSGQIGNPLAQKLTTQVFLFNQRPDIKNQNPEERVSSFYNIGSNDNQVSNYLERIKSFGTGVKSGFNESVLVGNRKLTGREEKIENKQNEKLNEAIRGEMAKIVK